MTSTRCWTGLRSLPQVRKGLLLWLKRGNGKKVLVWLAGSGARPRRPNEGGGAALGMWSMGRERGCAGASSAGNCHVGLHGVMGIGGTVWQRGGQGLVGLLLDAVCCCLCGTLAPLLGRCHNLAASWQAGREGPPGWQGADMYLRRTPHARGVSASCARRASLRGSCPSRRGSMEHFGHFTAGKRACCARTRPPLPARPRPCRTPAQAL